MVALMRYECGLKFTGCVFENMDSLAQSVSTQLNLSKADGLKAVNIIFDEMSEALQDDGNVDITSFGKFEIFHRKERMGINPITKERQESLSTSSAKVSWVK